MYIKPTSKTKTVITLQGTQVNKILFFSTSLHLDLYLVDQWVNIILKIYGGLLKVLGSNVDPVLLASLTRT